MNFLKRKFCLLSFQTFQDKNVRSVRQCVNLKLKKNSDLLNMGKVYRSVDISGFFEKKKF